MRTTPMRKVGILLIAGVLLTGAATKFTADQTNYLAPFTGAVPTPLTTRLKATVVVTDFGASPLGVADARTAFNSANSVTAAKWIPAGTYRIASNISLSGVWQFDAGAVLKPDSGKVITFASTAYVTGSGAVVDTSAGGSVVYTAGSAQSIRFLGAAAQTRNIVNGFAGNAVAADVGTSFIGGGGNAGTENYIGYSESLNRFTGNGATTTFTTSFDAAPAQIQLVLVRADGVRVTTVVSNATLTQSGTKVQVVYPQVGHFVNDAAGGTEGANAALLATEQLYVTSTIKTQLTGSGSDYSAVIAGYDNVTTGLRNTLEGAHHRITAGTHNSIIGGSYGRISGSGDYNAIFGGSGNEVSAGGSGSFISGFGNTVAGTGPGTAIGSTNSTNGAFATAIGTSNQANANGATAMGRLNVVTGADAFTSGNANTVSAPFSTVGGFTNSVTNATGYTAVFGRQNTSSGAYGITTGQSNTVTADWTRVAGKNASAALPFADVIGGEQIAALGDVQTATLVARRQTVDATPTEIRLGASTARLTIPNNTTWVFSILVTSRVATGTVSSGWKLEGVLKQDAGTVSIVGTVTKTLLAQDGGAAAWVINATADNTNKALSLTATGAAATTINWVARIEIAQVSG